MTINHWGRFELGHYYEDFNNMMSEETRKKICQTDALLIDEISMLDGYTFDILECMIAVIRNYHDVKDKVKRINAANNDNVMSQAML